MPIIPLQCPNCGGNLTVDSDKDAAICKFCGKPYIVKDAIVLAYIKSHTININAENVNVYTQKDFNIVSGTLYGYRGESVDVVIPNNVSVIANNAFNNLLIQSVTIPDSVTSIGSDAFQGCTALKSITIPDSVTSIGKGAFSGCTALKSITIPNSVTSIGKGAFSGCTALKSITIPDGVTSIDRDTFSGCTALESITMPYYIKSIGSYAFDKCSSLTSITIPYGVSEIIAYTFNDCTALKSITIPSSVSSIQYHAFDGCNNLSIINGKNWDHFPAFYYFPIFQSRLKQQNRCLYCGGSFEGVFKITCIKCHRPKDY